jgi:hypothetical protein
MPLLAFLFFFLREKALQSARFQTESIPPLRLEFSCIPGVFWSAILIPFPGESIYINF